MEQATTYSADSYSLLVLADRLRRLREEKEQAEEALKRLEQRIREAEQLMVAQMLEEEMPSFSRGGKTFYLYTRTYASPVAGRREELHRWLKEHGYESLVYETVNANSLSACIREMLEEANELPPDLKELVNVYEEHRIGIQKSRR